MATVEEVYTDENMHCFDCKVTNLKERYYVCLKLATRQIKEGKPIEQIARAGCKEAVDKRTCPALIMRKEELNKKEGIYFMKRPPENPSNPKVDVTGGSYRRGWLRNTISKITAAIKPTKKAKTKPASKLDAFEDGNESIYQKAINK